VLGHRAFGEVAAVGDLPFVLEVVEADADEADDTGLVREDADDTTCPPPTVPPDPVRRPLHHTA
jgi:hypothetical protein